jgi:hypothetical protein
MKVDFKEFTESEKIIFAAAWTAAGLPTEDAEAGADLPWCAPWLWRTRPLEVADDATMAEIVGAFWRAYGDEIASECEVTPEMEA